MVCLCSIRKRSRPGIAFGEQAEFLGGELHR
jgi:hypothetical protein